MFKTLIAGGRFEKETGKIRHVDPPLNFADILYAVIKNHILAWATGPSSFTVLALLEAQDFSHAAEVKKVLLENKNALGTAAEEEGPKQKAELGAKANTDVTSSATHKGGKAHKTQGNPVGNRGAKLLLEKLEG
jgi:pumilio family protein 6